jgi:hypothetical protein
MRPRGDAATRLVVDLEGRDIALPLTRRVLYEAARIGNPADIQGVAIGDTVTQVPGATERAIIAVFPTEDALVA